MCIDQAYERGPFLPARCPAAGTRATRDHLAKAAQVDATVSIDYLLRGVTDLAGIELDLDGRLRGDAPNWTR